MIHFDDWLLKADAGPVIARQYDNLTGRLEILGAFPEGWDWTLLVQADKHLDLIALTPMEGGLGVDLTAEMLAVSGYYTVQLKGVRGELVRHTNQVRIFIPDSLSGDANWPEVPSEFSQMEANIRELGEHPPIPGDEGFWLVWDLERDEYVTSDLPLPKVSEGPAGKAATIKVGETITGAPDTPAKVENTGTENEAVLRFTIPRGAVGPTGATPAISVEVTGLPAGSEPTVEVSGPPEAPVIALGIPAGRQGDPGTPGTNGQTPNITIGQVETLPPESPVSASITGETPNLVLNIGIPQGAAGVGLPALSGPEDAGKVPIVNGDGTGWILGAGGETQSPVVETINVTEDMLNQAWTEFQYSAKCSSVSIVFNSLPYSGYVYLKLANASNKTATLKFWPPANKYCCIEVESLLGIPPYVKNMTCNGATMSTEGFNPSGTILGEISAVTLGVSAGFTAACTACMILR